MSLWTTFTGGEARRNAENARDSNARDLNAGYDAQKGYYGQGYNDAKGYMQPYADAGRKGFDIYQNMLGNNGAAAQQGAQGAYNAFNPYLNAEQGRMQQSLDRRAAATGQMGSGLNALAKSRAVDESSFRNYSDYMNREQGLGQMGMQANAGLGNLAMQNAGNLAGVEQWYRGGNMQNNTNYWNAHSAAGKSGLQNVLGLGGTALQAMAGGMGGGPGMMAAGSPGGWSQAGDSMNGGWSTTATPASNNFLSKYMGMFG